MRSNPALKNRRADRWTIEALEARTLFSQAPAAHWALDEGSGSTAIDSTGNGHTGTLGSNVGWVAGNVGTHGISLDGSANAVVTVNGPVVDTSASFTASAWVELNSISGFQTVLSIAGSTVAGFYLGLRGDTGAFSFARLPSDAGGNATVVAAPVAPVAGTWYHIVGVDDATAGTLTLYVDDQSVGSVAYTGGWAAGGNTLIGHGFYGGGQVDFVNGDIDDVELFSSALSATQVIALDQPAAYSFDEATGTTAGDITGNGNTLTLGSGASWTPGHVGSGALALSGNAGADAIHSSPVINTAQPFSVSAWVNLNSLAGDQTIASVDGSNASAFTLGFSSAADRFIFSRPATDSGSAVVSSAAATTAPIVGTWFNLIGVDDVATSQLLLYVNGTLATTTSYASGWQGTGATVVGAGLINGTRTDFVNGDIDDLHFYEFPVNASDAAYIGTGGNSSISIAAGNSGITVSPALFGAFMEDINYGGDGGVYNDEVRNTGFNDSTNPLNAWSAVAGSGVSDSLFSDATTGPTSALTQSGKLTISSGISSSSRAGISNSGYFGVGVAPSTSYALQFFAKATAGFTGSLTVDLESAAGTVWATATVPAISSSWAEYTATLTTGSSTPTTSTNLLVISTNSSTANGATIWFGSTNLYPPSYENQSNHLRVDLMQMLAALHPAIFRVPGGNYLEGNDYSTRFEWANTIGPVQNRPGHYNSAWGYWSDDGMGLDEYLQMAEEAGAQPILAVYAGYTLNGASDTGTTLTNDVTDAINEIHYVLDPVTTAWGAERAANGHPAPYHVQDVEVGNEDFFSSTYSTRYPLFYNAIRAAFPSLKIIATSTSTGGMPFDVLDEHFYESPQWFENNSNYFDNVTRGSYQVFIGEYAANQGAPTNNMESALGDASWLLGLERNSDLVTMSSYAPLWVNVNGDQWVPDLIGFNNTSAYGSPSYYAQVMLANNHGSVVVSDSVSGATGLQTLVTKTGGTYYLTVINTTGNANAASINLTGTTSVASTGTVTSLVGLSDAATNSITNPTAIVPVTTSISGIASNFNYTFPGYSITILQLNATVDTPTVATAASASPAPVTGTTTHLSVLGADISGESNLTYTWSATGPANVSFSANGTNAAKNTVATFIAAGAYTFQALISNPAIGTSVISSVTVIVNDTPSAFSITPGTLNVAAGAAAAFTAGQADQFGNIISVASPTWSVISGGGSVNAAGVYLAPLTGGSATIQASIGGGMVATSTITIVTPVAWYKADSSSGTNLTDSSGQNENGRLNGSANFSSGVSGNALNLTGGYASLPTAIVNGLTNFTISAWVNVASFATWARIFDFGTGTTSYMFLTADASGTNAIRFSITTGGYGDEQQLNGPALQANTWTHIAITLAGSVGTLYVNGSTVAVNSAMSLNPSSLGTTNQNYLGKSQFSGDPSFQGSIDDFRIYNQALTASQVLALSTPVLLQSATASSSTVTGTTVKLSASATDLTAGASGLIYTWSSIGTPPGPVTFSANGNNAAQMTTVTFVTPGSYLFQVSVDDPNAGIVVTSNVAVVVNRALTSIVVTPAAANLYDGQTAQFSALAYDQFGAGLTTVFTWNVTGGGTIDSNGFYTAPASGPATSAITASAGGVIGSASENVILSVINGTSGNDSIRLVRSGSNLLVYINATTPTYNVSYGTLAALTVAGGTGTDTVNIDFSGGSAPVPYGGIFVNGSGGTATLILTGTATADTANVSSASINVNGSTVGYSNISQIVFNGNGGSDTLIQSAQPGNSARLSFNANISGGTSASDILNVSSGTYPFPMPVAGAGFQPISLNSLAIGGGAAVLLGSAAAASDRSVLMVNSLSMAVGGKLDLGGNDLVLHNSTATAANSTLTSISQFLSTGFNTGGAVWQGTGIVSSKAAGDTSHLMTLGVLLNTSLNTVDGQSVSGTDVLVKYTYFGDTNLDGKVDGSDYSRIDNGLIHTANGWNNGDLNYDGVINGSDYTLIDNSFNRQGAAIPSAMITTPNVTSASADDLKASRSAPRQTAVSLFSLTVMGEQRKQQFSAGSIWAALMVPDWLLVKLK